MNIQVKSNTWHRWCKTKYTFTHPPSSKCAELNFGVLLLGDRSGDSFENKKNNNKK